MIQIVINVVSVIDVVCSLSETYDGLSQMLAR